MNKKRSQLFCFTYAGGNTSFYDKLRLCLEQSLDVIPLEYAGHGKRHDEEFYKDFQELSNDMYRLLLEYYNPSIDYSLMGYSMGSIAVTELLKRIIDNSKIPLPKHVFLAAHEPHTKSELEGFLETDSDDFIKDRTIQFGGIHPKLIFNKSFWRIYLPLFKADYALIGRYNFNEINLNTDVPLTVFYSEADTPLDVMKEWKKYYTGNVDFFCFEGNHFFINEHYEKIANIIVKELM